MSFSLQSMCKPSQADYLRAVFGGYGCKSRGKTTRFPSSPPSIVKLARPPKTTVGLNSLTVMERKPATKANVASTAASPTFSWA